MWIRPRRRAWSCAAACAAAAWAGTAGPGRGAEDHWLPPPTLGEVQRLILEKANLFRREHGRPDLVENPALDEAARGFAAYLAGSGRFSHEADGRTPSERATAAGYAYCEIAENIAFAQDSRGFRTPELANLFMDGWKASPGHRRNLLDPLVTETGVAVAPAPGAPGKYLAVQEFGRPEAMRFSFRVVNRSAAQATYSLGGRQVRIAPGMVVTHTLCSPEDLALDGAAPVEPRPGATYQLRPGQGGLRLELAPAA